jgi:hypothetical protein
VVAVALLLTGLLGLARALTGALDLGQESRGTALATAAAQGAVEALFAADFARAFALYNDDPSDDPDGHGTAPGARFAVAGLEPASGDGSQGRILFPVESDAPGVLREDLLDARLRTPLDLDLDGALDDADHSADYRILPVVVRIEWHDGGRTRELEVATLLGAR